MKTCKIIPVYRKPVRNVLPYGKVISVPSQMPLDESQLLKATMQATVYEVIEGRGDVLLTRYNRNTDNSTAPVVLGVPAIIDYYDNDGNKVTPKAAEVEVKETPIVEKKVEKAPVETPVVEEKKEEATEVAPEEKAEEAAPVEETRVEEAPVEAPVAEEKKEEAQAKQQNNKKNNKK